MHSETHAEEDVPAYGKGSGLPAWAVFWTSMNGAP